MKHDLKLICANKQALKALKKTAKKEARSIIPSPTGESTKGAPYKEIAPGVIEVEFTGNTYLWLDEHGDVHVPGIFTKSISENKFIYHLHDHVPETTAKIGEMQLVSELPKTWKDYGLIEEGETEALVAKSHVYEKYNAIAYNSYLLGKAAQHSVGMYYVKMELAANYPEDEEAFKEWQKWYPKLGNKAKADEEGYFWVIYEAKLVEISYVLNGSNVLTSQNNTDVDKLLLQEIKTKFGNIQNLEQLCTALKNYEPPIGTQNNKPRSLKRKFLFT